MAKRDRQKVSRQAQAPPVSAPAAKGPRTRWLSLGLFVLVTAVYLPVTRNEFVNFDDPVYIYANAHVQQGFTWSAVRWAFTTFEGGFWHPLTWLSIMLDCRLFGLHAGGHHLTSVLLHAAERSSND